MILENSKHFINNAQEYKGKWSNLFNNDNPIHLEIGIGKGKFITEMAIKNPDINFIGIEKNASILAIATMKIEEYIPNLKVINIDAKEITDFFLNEIDLIYLNFSDPWPKKRHEKRRLTSPVFLGEYEKLAKVKPQIIMKTDNRDLFCYSIKSFNNEGFYIRELTFDLHNEEIFNITTEYEEKFMKLNSNIYMINVIKK